MDLSNNLTHVRLIAISSIIGNLMIASPARAETVDLSCSGNFGMRDTFVSIDTAANKVATWENGQNRDQAIVSPANISDQKVTWNWSTPTGYPGGLVEEFTFDRNTGALTNVVTNNGRSESNSWTCKRASRVF
jgi:hypothetical protein